MWLFLGQFTNSVGTSSKTSGITSSVYFLVPFLFFVFGTLLPFSNFTIICHAVAKALWPQLQAPSHIYKYMGTAPKIWYMNQVIPRLKYLRLLWNLSRQFSTHVPAKKRCRKKVIISSSLSILRRSCWHTYTLCNRLLPLRCSILGKSGRKPIFSKGRHHHFYCTFASSAKFKKKQLGFFFFLFLVK